MFLKISQNSQENTCAHSGVFIVNFEHIKACNFIKKESLAQVFHMNFAKFLRISFLQNFPDEWFFTYI